MSLGAVLFAAECVCCGGRTDSAAAFCARCARRLTPPPVVPVPVGLDACRALTTYSGAGRDLVVAIKFRGRHAATGWSARALGDLLGDVPVDVVTWAPTSAQRRRKRGFDQAELLARRLAPVLGVPWRRCLVRRSSASQTGHGRAERLAGPRFDGRRGLGDVVAGRRVLVVDDVVTTGATMTAAAHPLRAAGAAGVIGAALAHTLDR